MSVAKAQAAMTAPATPSNMDAQRQGFFDQCRTFGTNAGAGDTSKVGFFQATCEAAWQGIIAPAGRRKRGDTTSPPTDPEIAYDTFADARQKKAGEMGKRIAGKEGKDRKTRVSETNRMITLGSLPLIHDNEMGGLGVFNRALKLIKDNDEITGQVDDLLLKVAREQCGSPEKPLSNAQIKELLTPDDEPDESGPKPEVEQWDALRRRAEKIRAEFPDSKVDGKAKTVINNIAHMVDDLGGTKKMAEEKQKAEEERKKKGQVQRQGARGAKRKKA